MPAPASGSGAATASTTANASARRQVGRRPQAVSPLGAARYLPRHLLGKLTTPPASWVAKGAEIVLLPLLALWLGYFWVPQDPLQIHGAFPWPWIAPMLLALRYGPMAGLGGSGVLLAVWLALHWQQWDTFPQLYFLGGLITVMLVGEFSSVWQARARRAESLQLYLDQRLEHLVRQHYLLRLSHDRLERELIGRPMSMRDALCVLRDAGRSASASDMAHTTQQLVRLLAQFCQIESAALYYVTPEGMLDVPALAQMGAYNGLEANDPLIRQALQERQLCHISQTLATQETSRYVVVAPLLDLAEHIYGVLVVQDMPFFALQAENLQTLQLLLGYYTDGLSMNALAQPIVARYPHCPVTFAFEMQRLVHIYASTHVPSIIVALQFQERAIAHALPEQIVRLKRELDEIWLLKDLKNLKNVNESPASERQVLAVLMPLGDTSTAEGYLHRLEMWMQQKNQQTLAQAGVFHYVIPLNSQSPLHTVQRIEAVAYA